MATKQTRSEAVILEMYRVALNNAEQQPQIATLMAELGYDSTKIAEGKQLFAQTRAAFDFTKTEADETTEAYAHFKAKRQQLEQEFKAHRKRAKVAYRKDAVTESQLGIASPIPNAYANWLEQTRKFYSVAIANSAIQTKLATYAITVEQLNAANALITEVEEARTNYLREDGESQQATKAKDAAFAKIDDWMSEFYAIARIALEEHPQLLEALGKKA